MSDTVITIYMLVAMCLGVTLLIHSAAGHRRIASALMWWTFIGIFVSVVGGMLLVGAFTPDISNYSKTATDMYGAFDWGGIALPEYNDMLSKIYTLGAVINAMGLGILIMAVLAGFFPRSFFTPAKREEEDKTRTHGHGKKHV